MIPPPAMPNANSTTNVIKKLFMKYTDIDEQKYSEKCIIALKIMDILFKTEQCDKGEYQKVKDLVSYTCQNINKGVFTLDMMVNSSTQISYDDAKNYTKVFQRFMNEERTDVECVRFKLNEVQEILLKTSFKISEILHTVLIRNHLLDYYND
jgi:hypothetical protein